MAGVCDGADVSARAMEWGWHSRQECQPGGVLGPPLRSTSCEASRWVEAPPMARVCRRMSADGIDILLGEGVPYAAVVRSMGWTENSVECWHALREGGVVMKMGGRSVMLMRYVRTFSSQADSIVPLGDADSLAWCVWDRTIHKVQWGMICVELKCFSFP